jgi:hypothetical protein
MVNAITKTTVSASDAKKGVSGKTTRTNIVTVSRPYMEILIGGHYILDGEEHTYGHVALRVFVKKERDFVYDFGRYGKTWGVFRDEGDGILRVWSSFEEYISSENAYKRITTGFMYYLEISRANTVISHFEEKIKTATKNGKRGTFMTSYILKENYHAVRNNCTTITISGSKKSGKTIVYNPFEYLGYRGLTTTEKMAAHTQKGPEDIIFMPEDFREMLEGNKTQPYDKKNIYQFARKSE